MISYSNDTINRLRWSQVGVSDKETARWLCRRSEPALVCTMTSPFAGMRKSQSAEQKSCFPCSLYSCQLYCEDPASPWITIYPSPYNESKLVHKAARMKDGHSGASIEDLFQRNLIWTVSSVIFPRKNRKRLSLTGKRKRERERAPSRERCVERTERRNLGTVCWKTRNEWKPWGLGQTTYSGQLKDLFLHPMRRDWETGTHHLLDHTATGSKPLRSCWKGITPFPLQSCCAFGRVCWHLTWLQGNWKMSRTMSWVQRRDQDEMNVSEMHQQERTIKPCVSMGSLEATLTTVCFYVLALHWNDYFLAPIFQF